MSFCLRPAHVRSARLVHPAHARLVIFLGSLASNLDRFARAGSIYTDASMITPLCQPPLQVVAIVAGRRRWLPNIMFSCGLMEVIWVKMLVE